MSEDYEDLIAEARAAYALQQRVGGRTDLIARLADCIESLAEHSTESRANGWDEAIDTAREYGWLPAAAQSAFRANNPYRALTEGTKE